MLKLAHQLDIEVVPVDILPYRPNTVRVDSETIRMRDEAMSKNILNILGGRTDRKVLFWVGQHHLIDNKPFEDRPGYESAGRRLKQAVPTITIFDGSTWSQQAQRVPILSRKVSPNPFLIHTRECFELQNEPTSFERDEFHLNKEYDIALFTYRRWKDLFVPGDYPY